MLGITTLLERRPARLSGGQQQRVALGRAIVRRPQAMLLDEPLASLDVPMRLSLRRELKRLHRELGLTMVYVTHDQAEAMALGDRIAVMNEGRLEQVGAPEDVYRRPATKFVARFFGSHGMNIVTGELEDNGKGCVVHSGVLPVPAADWPADTLIDGEVMIGFRPEDAVLLSSVEPGQLAWEVEVVAVEYQGEASYATVRPLPEGRETCVVRVESRDQITRGEHRLLAIRPGHLHWFGSDGKQFA
jgi:ABC-type sugar transport system ATPase subunit